MNLKRKAGFDFVLLLFGAGIGFVGGCFGSSKLVCRLWFLDRSSLMDNL